MTVQEQRAYVFAKWVDVREEVGPHKVTERPSEWMRYVLISGRVEGSGTGDEAIAAAYAFTLAREREIAELEEEIGFVTYYLEETEHAVWKRLRERLTAILEEKRKGFRRESEAKETQA